MDITPLIDSDSMIIQGYGPERFRVSGTVYESAVMVFPDRVAVWEFTGSPDKLTAEDFTALFETAGDVEVVLLGCGETGMFVPPALRQAFKDKGMTLEAMDTGAACRTYNVLLSEGRRVAALLLPL